MNVIKLNFAAPLIKPTSCLDVVILVPIDRWNSQ